MKRQIFNFSQRYQEALRNYLRQGPPSSMGSARGLGGQAMAAGLQTLDLAKLHEETLVSEVLPECPAGQTRRPHQTGGSVFCRSHSPD